MIPLMLAIACGAEDATTSGDTGAAVDSDNTAASGTTDTEPPTEVTDTVSLYGTAPEIAVPLPQFAAFNQLGEPRGPDDLSGHPTVLWFYPLADTAG